MAKTDLAAFFRPRSVAVVGASERETSSGGAVMQMMHRAGFDGTLIPVNPKGGRCFDRDVATSLKDIETPTDLAIVAVRPDFIPAVVSEAAESGFQNLLILPGGFSEAGPEGEARESEVEAIAARAGLTIVGPNCAGIINLTEGEHLGATFLRDLPPGGGIALISQSGALAEEVIANSRRNDYPVGKIVSVGNALHLGVEDYLEFLGDDDSVSCILLYVESFRDPDNMARLCRDISKRKPVIALIPGQTEPGRAAAKAHTGSTPMASHEVDGFCADNGILRVKSLRELMLAAKGFGFYPHGFGPRTLILSNSGGPGVLTTDQACRSGLDLAELPTAMAKRLEAELPGEAAIRNPLDLLADAREDRFGVTLDAALTEGSDCYDAIIMIHVVPFMVDAGPVIDRLAEMCANSDVPIMHSMMGTLVRKDHWFTKMESAGVPMFDNVEDMARCAGLLARYHRVKGGHPK